MIYFLLKHVSMVIKQVSMVIKSLLTSETIKYRVSHFTINDNKKEIMYLTTFFTLIHL